MSAETLQNMAMASAILGLACFIWPTLRRLTGGDAGVPGLPTLKSPLWWAGLGFTLLALILLRFASGAA